MESKPALHSVTLWVNALLPVVYMFVPGLREALSPEVALTIVGAINAVIRVFKTDKPISGVL